MVNIIFQGRHHLLTKFQHDYFKNLISNGINGKKIDKLFIIVTSANHENTRRNPIPLYLRVIALVKFIKDFNCKIKIYPIPDIEKTDKFAKFCLNQIYYQSGEKLTPKNTIFCNSTPELIRQYKKLGFKTLTMELINAKEEKYSTLRPFEVINLFLRPGKNWRNDKKWKKYTSEATQELFLQYSLGDLIIELFKDSLLNEDADITETRDYNTYAKEMDNIAEIKFNDIKPFVVDGKIVDAGCSTGALISMLAREFQESDIIGIEATRKFYEYCRLQDYKNPFVFFYRRNILDQNFKDNSINTFIYSSVLHEIYSYINESALKNLLKNIYKQLKHKGRIIIRDVVGPENPNQLIYMELNGKDGKEKGSIKELSTYSKFFKFVKDFKPRKIKFQKVKIKDKNLIFLKLKDAYEYISKMNYTDNWESEMHEDFSFYSYSKWEKELKKIGFKIVKGSKPFRNRYIIENVYKGKVILYRKIKNKLTLTDYPYTNMILAGEK